MQITTKIDLFNEYLTKRIYNKLLMGFYFQQKFGELGVNEWNILLRCVTNCFGKKIIKIFKELKIKNMILDKFEMLILL